MSHFLTNCFLILYCSLLLSVPFPLSLHPWHHILESELAKYFINDVLNEVWYVLQFVGVDKMSHKEHCAISLLVLCCVGRKRSWYQLGFLHVMVKLGIVYKIEQIVKTPANNRAIKWCASLTRCWWRRWGCHCRVKTNN